MYFSVPVRVVLGNILFKIIRFSHVLNGTINEGGCITKTFLLVLTVISQEVYVKIFAENCSSHTRTKQQLIHLWRRRK